MKDGVDAAFARLVSDRPLELNVVTDDAFALPLVSAVFCGRRDCARDLIRAGADVNGRDSSRKGSSYNLRALEAALWQDEEEIESLLLESGATEDFGTLVFRGDATAVREAIEKEPAFLESAYIHPGFNLLHIAAEIDSAELAIVLMESGLDPNATDDEGHAPLRYASRNEPSLEVLEALITGGADVNLCSATGITALTAACRHEESLPTIRRLLELGADPNLVPKNRVSALMKAAGNRAPEMVEVLLAGGADPDYRGKGGETALDVARRRKASRVIEILER